MRRVLLTMIVLLALTQPAAIAEHSVPFCYGGERGYWMPAFAADQTVLLYLTRRDGSLAPADTICRVRNEQLLRAMPLDKLASQGNERRASR